MEEKYVAMDVHSATISVVVLESDGKKRLSMVMQTKEDVIRDFLTGLSGKVYLTFEEGCMAAWLYEITRPLVSKVLVCNPRHNRLINSGNKSDRIDAEKLAELLRVGSLKAVYHQTHSVEELKELVAIYAQLTKDRTRVMNRLKSVFRSRGLTIKLGDKDKRAEYVKQLPTAARRERAGFLLAELDMLDELQKRSCKQMKAEAKKHPDYKRLQSLPGIQYIRAAELLAWGVTPARFRTKRQFWSYCGLSVVTRASADYEIKNGSIVPTRRKKAAITRGLNRNYNRGMKKLFKGAAVDSLRNKQIRPYYDQLLERGLDESVAKVQLARKLAASCLAIWKSGEEFEYKKLILNSDKT